MSSNAKLHLAYWLIPLFFILMFPPWMSSSWALLLGIAVGLFLGNPHLPKVRKISKKLLTYSVVLLGAGMNLVEVAKVGANGIVYTVVGISATLALGFWLARYWVVERETSLLVSVGTAICGGSAIAAVAPVIRARDEAVSVALITVFLLNGIALFVFPPLGHWFAMTQHQFGLWCALAIHDTSSVVGASLQFGAEAVKTATTVKLARAFWIAPVAFLIGMFFKPSQGTKEENLGKLNAPRPWFILGFLVMAAIFTYFSEWQSLGDFLASAGKRGLVATLFLIGTTLRQESLKEVGPRPFFFGLALWILVSSVTLGLILGGQIC